jgi:DNA-binding GntR family transcriptional regulator
MAKDTKSGEKPKAARGPRGSNAGTIYEQLRKDIVSMKLAPGEVLDEVGLSKRFNLSRSPIREAIVRLASEGLVTVLPNRSTIVSIIEVQRLPSFFDALELMQRVVTRLAALHCSAEILERIKACETEFEHALGQSDLGKMLAANYDYHMTIAEASNNKYFAMLYGRLLDEGKRLLTTSFNMETERRGPGSSQLVKEHAEITRAIEKGDADTAERLGYEHAVEFRNRILKTLAISETDNIMVA